MEAVYLNDLSADFGNRSSSLFNGGSNGILYTPPFAMSYSSLSSSSLLNPDSHQHHHYYRHHQQQNQPPLLPLPNSKPYQNNRRRINTTTNHQSLSVRKSNVSVAGGLDREKFKHQLIRSHSVINGQGPDLKDVPRVLSSGRSHNNGSNYNHQVIKFSGSVVSSVLSPPPSSLPLPTFSLRPKAQLRS